MKAFLKKILAKPIVRMADKLASSPDSKAIHQSLDQLYRQLTTTPEQSNQFPIGDVKFLLFSDHHRRKGDAADAFRNAKENYAAALDYYYRRNFTLINR